MYLSLVLVFFVALFLNISSASALSIGDLIQSEWVNAALIFLLLFNFVITIFRDVFKSNYGAAIVISLVVAIAGSLSVVYYFGAFLSKIGLWLLILFILAIALLMMRFVKGKKGKVGFIVLGVGSIVWLAWLHKMLCPPLGTLPFNVCQVFDVISLIVLAVVVVKAIFWLIGWATGKGLNKGGDGGWKPDKPGKPGKDGDDGKDGEKGAVFIRMIVRGKGKVVNSVNLTEFTEGTSTLRTERRPFVFVAHPLQDSFMYWMYDSPWGLKKSRNRMLRINLRHVLYRRKNMIRVGAIFAKGGATPAALPPGQNESGIPAISHQSGHYSFSVSRNPAGQNMPVKFMWDSGENVHRVIIVLERGKQISGGRIGSFVYSPQDSFVAHAFFKDERGATVQHRTISLNVMKAIEHQKEQQNENKNLKLKEYYEKLYLEKRREKERIQSEMNNLNRGALNEYIRQKKTIERELKQIQKHPELRGGIQIHLRQVNQKIEGIKNEENKFKQKLRTLDSEMNELTKKISKYNFEAKKVSR